MEQGGREKRKDPRVTYPCRIVIRSAQGEFVTSVENISKGGVKVILGEKINFSTQVNLKIFLKKDKTIECEGVVVWVMEKRNPIDKESFMYHTGIAFKKISDSDREIIKEIISTLLRKFQNEPNKAD